MKKYLLFISIANFIVGNALWIYETNYFGWNWTPKSPIEAVLDIVSSIIVGTGIVGIAYFIPQIKSTEWFYEQLNERAKK